MGALIKGIAASREDMTNAFRTLNGLFHQIDGHIPETIEAVANTVLRNRIFSCLLLLSLPIARPISLRLSFLFSPSYI